MISNTSNSQIKTIVKLQKQSKMRAEQGLFVCEGQKMFQEAVSQKRELIEKVYFSERFFQDNCADNPEYYRDIAYEIVTDSVLQEASDTKTPQGVLALMKQPSYELSSMINKEKVRLLLLEDLRDPGNLGTMIRTAEAVGMSGVIMSPGTVDIFNPKVIRSTMGAIFRVPFLYSDNFKQTLCLLKEQGVDIVAAHLDGAVWYDDIEYYDKTALLIGNEANGLSEEITNLSSRRVKIPMEGQVESLNAAIAAAVLMYESYRQTREKSNINKYM